jgi:hypothetical protein
VISIQKGEKSMVTIVQFNDNEKREECRVENKGRSKKVSVLGAFWDKDLKEYFYPYPFMIVRGLTKGRKATGGNQGEVQQHVKGGNTIWAGERDGSY